MVLCKAAEACDVFESLTKAWMANERNPIHIIVSNDTDSICTCRILTTLLLSEGVTYSLFVVDSYESLSKRNQDTLQPGIALGQIHSVVLVNCGGTVNLIDFLFMAPRKHELEAHLLAERSQAPDGALTDSEERELIVAFWDRFELPDPDHFRLYVLDFHRPFHLKNVFDNDYVFLLQSEFGETDERKLPQPMDAESKSSFVENDEEEIDTTSIASSALHDDLRADLQQDDDAEDDDDSFNLDDLDSSDDGTDDGSDEEHIGGPPKKRRRISPPTKKPTVEASSKESRETEEVGASVGERHAAEMDRRRQHDADLREYYRFSWHATDSGAIAYNIARELHKCDAAILWCAILSMTECFLAGRSERPTYNEAVRKYSTEAVSLASARIQFTEELQLVLLRFWNVFDAMHYSPYTATRLAVWKQSGRDALKYLLAKMALPLSEARQPYTSMARATKKQLATMLSTEWPQLAFGSFVHSKQNLGAADVIHCLHTALESEIPLSEDPQRLNFWYAYDLITEAQDSARVLTVVGMAKERQKQMVEMGTRLIDKRKIVTLDFMRYCVIDSKNAFQSESLLRKLAAFVRSARQQSTRRRGKEYKQLPFVVASLLDAADTYLVIGLSPQNAHCTKSPMHSAFREAAQTVGAKATFDSFDANVVHVSKEDLTEWLLHVHERLYAISIE